MPPENPADLTSLAVAIGTMSGAMTEGFKSVNDRLDKLTTASEAHGDTLQRHEVEIQLLKSKEPPAPTAPVKKTWIEVFGGIASALTVFTTIVGIIVIIAIGAPLLAKLGG